MNWEIIKYKKKYKNPTNWMLTIMLHIALFTIFCVINEKLNL